MWKHDSSVLNIKPDTASNKIKYMGSNLHDNLEGEARYLWRCIKYLSETDGIRSHVNFRSRVCCKSFPCSLLPGSQKVFGFFLHNTIQTTVQIMTSLNYTVGTIPSNYRNLEESAASPSQMLRISWPLWMDWIISRIHSFSCSMVDAVSRKASTLTDTFKSTLAQCKIVMIQCCCEERAQQRGKCTACTFGTHAAAACCWQLYLASSWSKLSRSRPQRSAMDRLLLNLAVVASVIFACILAWAMPESDGGSCLWSARRQTRPHGAQLAWLWRDSSDAPGSTFPILGCGFFYSVRAEASRGDQKRGFQCLVRGPPRGPF